MTCVFCTRTGEETVGEVITFHCSRLHKNNFLSEDRGLCQMHYKDPGLEHLFTMFRGPDPDCRECRGRGISLATMHCPCTATITGPHGFYTPPGGHWYNEPIEMTATVVMAQDRCMKDVVLEGWK